MQQVMKVELGIAKPGIDLSPVLVVTRLPLRKWDNPYAVIGGVMGAADGCRLTDAEFEGR